MKARTTSLDGLAMGVALAPEPGLGEVRVTVHAASLSYRDQLILTGAYGQSVPRDLVPVSEGAGVIDAVGEGVTERSATA